MISITIHKKDSICQFWRMLSVLLFSVCVFSGCISTSEEDYTGSNDLAVGQTLPTFTVPEYDTNGFVGNVSTADLKGRKSIIVLFNTNCKDCQQELPVIQQLYDSIDHTAIKMLLIARAEELDEIKAYWQANGLTMPFSPQEDKTVFELFASSIIPRTYICNESCKVTEAFDDDPLPTFQQLSISLTGK